ncbi:MAG: helix-turn-helix domain-containing protein [Patescibacteria group bacterium]|nr:helix-turn-helix domain-containing protein [Patescibacteria group bacterium]
MANVNLRDLPATKDYMKAFANQVFQPIINGESNAVITIPKFGANSFIKYIIRFAEEFDEDLKVKIEESTWIRLELSGITTEDELWKYIYNELIRKFPEGETSSSIKAMAGVLSIIEDQVNRDRNLVFVFNSAELLIDNKKELAAPIYTISTLAGFVKFLLVFYKEELGDQLLDLLSKLRVNQHVYLEMRSSQDMKILIEKEERWYGYKLSENVKVKVAELSGGFASLCRGILSFANTDLSKFEKASPEAIASNSSVSIWLLSTYNSLSDRSKGLLMQILINKKFKKADLPNYLVKTGIIKDTDGKLTFFSPLFEHFLREVNKNEEKFVVKGSRVFLYDMPIRKIFSKQEYQVFEQLWKSKNRIVARDRLSKIMWGKNWKEKYSDWAIDRVVHKIRNKIGDSEKEIIQTLKGKGFKLVTK